MTLPLTKERIEAKVERLTECGCWIWMGGCQMRGYGELLSNNKKYSAHRASYLLYKGEIPKGMYVCHKCDTVSCVNPDHLFLGTQKDNLQDMARKGRSTKGEKNGQAKLTTNQIKEIISSQDTHQSIADKFGVSRSHVGLIKNKERWAHV